MGFRYDINALRAIAVIGVVLFHFKVPYFDGGFSGVDIFYVISGYLMTRIIINGLYQDQFSVLDFYNRRIRRIVPALLFLIAVLTVAGFFLLLPIDYQLFAKNAASSLLFVSNIVYWRNSSYFDPSSDNNMLLHTWSLSVEWQFYLILPLVLMLLHRWFHQSTRLYLFIFIGVTLLAFAGSCFLTDLKPVASFYLFPTRAWEMLMGGIAFFCEGYTKRKKNQSLALTGYAILITGVALLKTTAPWPGMYTLIPVLATFLVIISNVNDFALIKNPIVQEMGKISYSLYLWHWPIYVLARYLGVKEGLTASACFIILSLLFAYISYRYIESFRFKTNKRIIAATVLTSLCTLFVAMTDTNTVLYQKKTLEIMNYNNAHVIDQEKQFSNGCCFVSASAAGLKALKQDQCLRIRKGEKNILLLGDSHAAHFSQSFEEYFKKKQVHLNHASASGCLPILRENGASQCHEIIDFIFKDYLPQHASQINGVVISANWQLAENPDQLVEDLQHTIDYLHYLHIKVLILGQNETYTVPFTSIIAREYQYHQQISDNFINRRAYAIHELLKNKLKPYYVDIYHLKTPKLSPKFDPYMSDENHFSAYGAQMVTKKIFSTPLMNDFIN